MRTRLSYEIFGVFLLASLVLVILTIAALRFFFYVGFQEYVHKKDLQKLPYVAQVLEREYTRPGAWNKLKGNPDAWYEILSAASTLQRSADENPKDRNRDQGDKSAGLKTKKKRGHRYWQEFFLLDEKKKVLAGNPGDKDTEEILELKVDGRTVGWLGVRIRSPKWSPLDVAFMEQQFRMFYIMGAGVFLLAALISILLSKRLLGPIKKLTQGTQALASRRFDTRIGVRTSNELGRLAHDFNQMAETLETYEKMRQDWISDISHELRTPLAILQGEIQALQEGVRSVTPESIDSLKAEIDNLAKLVEDLHLLALADSEGLVKREDQIRPLKILAQQVEAFKEQMNRRKITVRMDLKGAESLQVIGDEDRLGRVFSNILQNSLQYTDSPGTLDIRAVDKADRMEITFEDSPPGVPDEALGRLFDRLYRVDASRSRTLGGSGLGLSIARQIVKSHGGTITASHGSAGGIKVTITLPLAAESRKGFV
jgi:two-component system sensor histidine kinase BaeS